jgi:hypothetical protein
MRRFRARFRGRALSDTPGGPADPGGSPHDGKPSADVCDSCSVKLDRAQGYYLATARIVMSESFWGSHFARVKGIVDTFNWDERSDLRKFDGMLRYVAGSATPWLICENCSELFLFDRDEARSYAIRAADPPDTGPVDPGECATQAAAGWEHVFGRWPASVQQPEVADSCDLCAKNIYRGEFAGSVGTTQLDRFRAIGAIEGPPLSPARPNGTWLVCRMCLNRFLAQMHRAAQGASQPPRRS